MSRIRDPGFQRILDQNVAVVAHKKLVEFLRKKSLRVNTILRFNNYLLLSSQSRSLDENLEELFREIEPELRRFIQSNKVTKAFDVYTDYLKTLEKYSLDEFQSEAKRVFAFFHLKRSPIKFLAVHINALDAQGRGTNYNIPNTPLVSIPVMPDGEISFQGYRHELMHILLKTIYSNSLEHYGYHLHIPENYAQDSRRVQFDEYFIITANLFFFPDDRQEKQVEYLQKNGFIDIGIFRDFIKQHFYRGQSILSVEVLDKLQYTLESMLS